MAGEVTRRQALGITGLGAAATVAGAVGTWRTFGPSDSLSSSGGAFAEPPVLRSAGGTLEVALRAAAGVTVDGRRTRALGYNGTSPGPTLVVRPGDLLRVRLENALDATTNLHTHGLHVSPEGNGDNVFRAVEPGTSAAVMTRSTPGAMPAALVSIPRIRACGCAAQMTLPYSIPGRTMSSAYVRRPRTLRWPSMSIAGAPSPPKVGFQPSYFAGSRSHSPACWTASKIWR